jgi:hypothetical protein
MDFFQNFGGVHRRLAYYPEASAGNGQVFSEELIAPKIEPNDQNLKGYGQDQVPSKRKQADVGSGNVSASHTEKPSEIPPGIG